MKKEIKIDGMTCNHCVAAVEGALNNLDGMKKVKVNLKKGKANVTYDETKITDDILCSSIEEAGYQAEVV